MTSLYDSTREGKLVRDGIPETIRATGAVPIIARSVDRREYLTLLKNKLVEESNEVLAATDDKVLGELIDVLEVTLTLAAELGFDSAQLECLRASKRDKRGGFQQRIVWHGNL